MSLFERYGRSKRKIIIDGKIKQRMERFTGDFITAIASLR